jgi:hypothetical protein
MLRRTQFSLVKRHWRPIKLVKVGDDKHYASDATISAVEDALNTATQDLDAWFVWHNFISVEYAGGSPNVLTLNNEYDWVEKEILYGLGISKAILSADGPGYTQASIGLRVLANRFMRFQRLLANWIRKTIYEPIARIHDLTTVDKDTGEKKLQIPKIEWELMQLREDAQLKTIYQALQAKGLISKRTLLARMGIDPDHEHELVQKEKEEEKKEKAREKTIPTMTPPGSPVGGGEPGMPGPPPEMGGGGGITPPEEAAPPGGPTELEKPPEMIGPGGGQE